jgi:cyanate permease
VFGALRDATGGWDAPVAILVAVWVLIGLVGMAAGRPRIAAET